MTEEKTCYNCGNKNCNVYYSMVKKNYKRHFETYEYNDFDCVNHDKWKELRVEEIHTDNTKTLQNALDRIEELEEYIEQLKGCHNCRHLAEPYKLCCYSLGDEDYYCRGRKWEIKENEAGAEFGYNKANEWQYPSKGELPKCDEETQLMFYVNCYYEIDGETKIRKRTVLGFYKKSFMNDVKLFVEKSKGYEEEHLSKDVIAWKEIVLPELKEIE